MMKLKAMINIHDTHRKKNNYKTYPSIFKLIQSDKQHTVYGEKEKFQMSATFPLEGRLFIGIKGIRGGGGGGGDS